MVQCKLRTVSLDHCPPFVALSYLWGNPEDTNAAKVNGVDFRITKNLEAALQQLRLDMHMEKNYILIFADAICINQKDKQERKYQVGLMGKIYNKAEEVVAWLGDSPPTDVDFKAVYLIESWADKEFDEELDIEEITSRGTYKSFWSRLWILQEIVLARKATFFFNYGLRRRISFEAFEKAVSRWNEVRDPELTEQTRAVPFIFNVPLEKFGLFTTLRESYHKQAKRPDILSLLRRCQHMQCIDHLDRFYAILDVVDDNHKIIPDYEKRPVDVFTDFARDVITIDQKLDILADAGIRGSESSVQDGMFSWVPDWKAHQGEAIFQVHLYQACGNTRPQSGSAGNKYHLLATGVRVMKIIEVEPARPMSEDPRKLIGAEFAYFRAMVLDIDCVTNKRLNSNGKPFFDLAAGFLFFLGLMLLTDDKDITLEDLTIEFFVKWAAQNTIDNLFTQEILEPFLGWPDTQTRPGISWPVEDNPDRGHKYAKLFYTDMKSKTKDLRFFKAGDYIGLGPQGIAPGDSVCVLWGCNVPLVLRAVGDAYILLGPCFVYGLMDGEGARMAKEANVKPESFLLR
ncbi:MAG: hypothetical protein M1840_003018 [Geoglossum simile]|nr:MAG: hypothetical protein M1840_003018 [Geoglossum simile]